MDREGKVEKRNSSSDLGGTMRKGAQRVPIKSGTRAQAIYGDEVNERHRHRYEVNNVYVPRLEEAGMVISARTPSENLPEMMELPDHPWFVGVQFHPESVLTEGGYRMLGNWLESVGLSGAAERGGRLSPLVRQD